MTAYAISPVVDDPAKLESAPYESTVSPGPVDGGERVIGGSVDADLDAAVATVVTAVGAAHDEPITRIVIEPLDCGRRGDPRPAALAVHAYNADGLRVDARYIEASR